MIDFKDLNLTKWNETRNQYEKIFQTNKLTFQLEKTR